jgi:thymidine kinase
VAENPLEQMASQGRTCASEHISAIDEWGRTLQLGRTGSLKMLLGPMFAGKSSRLLEATNSNSAVTRTVIEVNHMSDDRYSTEGTVTTHSGLSSTCGNRVHKLVLARLADLLTNGAYRSLLDRAAVVCIDEVQWFDDAAEVIPQLVDELQKQVIVAGLQGMADRTACPNVLELLGHADSIEICHAKCILCGDGTPGIFSQKIMQVEDGAEVDIGGADKYRAVCRRHYTGGCTATAIANAHTATIAAGAAAVAATALVQRWCWLTPSANGVTKTTKKKLAMCPVLARRSTD